MDGAGPELVLLLVGGGVCTVLPQPGSPACWAPAIVCKRGSFLLPSLSLVPRQTPAPRGVQDGDPESTRLPSRRPLLSPTSHLLLGFLLPGLQGGHLPRDLVAPKVLLVLTGLRGAVISTCCALSIRKGPVPSVITSTRSVSGW